MSWRAVMVYWALALVVAGQLAWTLRSRAHPVEAEATAASPILPGGAAVDHILARHGDTALEFHKSSGRWEGEDTGTQVSSDLIAAFVDTLSTIPPVQIMPEGSGTLASYGLDPPESIVRMATAGSPVATIEIGARNPTRTAVYARRPDEKQVYLLGLNAQYYLELIFEQAAGRRSPTGPS